MEAALQRFCDKFLTPIDVAPIVRITNPIYQCTESTSDEAAVYDIYKTDNGYCVFTDSDRPISDAHACTTLAEALDWITDRSIPGGGAVVNQLKYIPNNYGITTSTPGLVSNSTNQDLISAINMFVDGIHPNI